MVDCIFCKIIEGTIPSKTFHVDEHVIAFLDINPATRGHSLVVPKRHFRLMNDASDEEIAKIFVAVKHVARQLVESLNADGFNVLANQGREAGQVIDHFHVHVIPRYKADGIHFAPPERKTTQDELDSTLATLAK